MAQPRLSLQQDAALTQAAIHAYGKANRVGRTPRGVALAAALDVGRWAAQNAIPKEAIPAWLARAYARVWIAQTGHLHPGADAKDVLCEILWGYRRAARLRSNPDALGTAALVAGAVGTFLLWDKHHRQRTRVAAKPTTQARWTSAPVPDRPGQREYTRAAAGKVYIILHDPRTSRAFLDVMHAAGPLKGQVKRIVGPGRFGEFSSPGQAQALVDRMSPARANPASGKKPRGRKNPDVIVRPRDLPPSVQMHLPSKNTDVRVRPGPWRPPVAGDGRRGVVVVASLADGTVAKTEWGAWGGASPFGRTIDEHPGGPVPRGMFALTYTEGSGASYPVLYVHPDDLVPQVEAAPPISATEGAALEILGGILSSYRADEWSRRKIPGRYTATNPIIQRLVQLGYAKVNAAGGIQITTAGKNARERLPPGMKFNPAAPVRRKGMLVVATRHIEEAQMHGRVTVAREGAIGTVVRARPDLLVRFSRERGQAGGDVVCGREEVAPVGGKLRLDKAAPAAKDAYLKGLARKVRR